MPPSTVRHEYSRSIYKALKPAADGLNSPLFPSNINSLHSQHRRTLVR